MDGEGACSSISLDHKWPAVGKGELPSAGERLRSNREAARRASERRPTCSEEQPHAAMPGAWWTGCWTDATGFTPVTLTFAYLQAFGAEQGAYITPKASSLPPARPIKATIICPDGAP
jgi:hypothetical protein